MPTTPATVPTLPTAPDPNDRSTFNTRAYPWSAALDPWTVAVNSAAAATNTNALEAEADAVTANTKAGEAAASATTASTAATTASSAATTATTKAGEASASATAAAASATTASSAASTAAASVSATLTAAVAASATTATNAATSATASATAAANSASSAAAIVLGVSTGHPTVRPSLNLDFANSQTLDPRITFTRASTATRTNAKGLIESVASGAPRIDYDPVTGVCKGLLIEESRTNLLLNSAVNGSDLATQSVTVTAASQTLSFYGAGSISLSGAHTATLTGAGAYPSRATLTFTPAAGSLTLTVTGTVQFAQLEIGAFATSHIPTAGASVTRAAESAVIDGTNFSNVYRQDEGTIFVECSPLATLYATTGHIVSLSAGTTAEFFLIQRNSALASSFATTAGSVAQSALTGSTIATGSTVKLAFAAKLNDVIGAHDGTLTAADTAATMPAVTKMHIGSRYDGLRYMTGHFRSLRYYTKRLSNAELQTITAA